MLNKNNLIIAAAGSGKTTYLVKTALAEKNKNILITTYTQANEAEIKNKIIEENKCIPENITVQTWFSFLLQHGVKPFQGTLFEKKLQGFLLVNHQSGLKRYINQCPECKKNNIVKLCSKCQKPIYYSEEKEFEKHYFTKGLKIFSDKLSKFVFRCNEKTKGCVIERISKIFDIILIDEVQDLAGYDLELLKLLFNSKSETLLVGDPRQGTYSTNSSSKNKQFKKSQIVYFFEDDSMKINRNDKLLTVNYRSNKIICEFSNLLFPDFPETTSGNSQITGHDGIFFINERDIENYLDIYKPMQLRDSAKKKVNEKYNVKNFGESKGLSFDRVLIYPTKPFLKWLIDNNSELLATSRSKLYVALTRAKYSVGIVTNKDNISVKGIPYYKPDNNLNKNKEDI